MTKALLKNLETALELLMERSKAIRNWSTAYDPEVHDILLVDEKLGALEQINTDYLSKFNDILTLIPEDQVAGRTALFHTFQSELDNLVVTLKRIKVNNREAHPPPLPPLGQEPRIQLPTIPLPQFKGSIGDWVFFRDKFTALIIENESLNEIQRLYYLKSSLIDEAASLQSSNDTFQSLWNALKERFEVKRVIADNQISELLGLRSMSRESASDLKHLVDIVTRNLRVLETLELPVDGLSELLLINIICTKLDAETRRGFEIHLKPNVLPRVGELLTFLRHRSHTLETIEFSTKSNSRAATQGIHTTQRKSTSRSNALHVNTNKCPFCSQSQSHYANQCAVFLAMTPDERYTSTKKANLCINCLRNDHSVGECKSGVCRQCQRKHHTLLHFEKKRTNPGGANGGGTIQTEVTNSLVVNSNQVLLSTVIVNILDADAAPVRCRALLDSGSQSNFVTENLAQLVRLTRTRVSTSVHGLGQQPTTIKSRITATIQSLRSPYTVKLDFLVVPKVTGHIPHAPLRLTARRLDLPASVELADPQFYKPQIIDLLIGAEIFFEIWTGQQLHINNALPPLQGSVFGWVVAGRVSTNLITINQPQFCGVLSNPQEELLNAVKRFWELEAIDKRSVLTIEEKKIEQHFQKTHKRLPNGRYVVNLPMKPEVTQLGDSRQMALTRFTHLERKLNRCAELRGQYCAFMDEYERLGHMTLAPASSPSPELPSYFLPHHAVLKPESSSTKCRVVFDGSAKTTNGLSLNEVLLVGPTVQQDLMDIILRFRKHRYVFTADVGKMYRQVLVDEGQQQLQQILWRPRPSGAVNSYFLKTVTYGTASAPYLATRVLNQLADDEQQEFPEAAIVAKRDFYVDDVLSGADNLEEAIKLQRQLDQMLHRGGFELHKWCANHQKLLSNIPNHKREQKLVLSDDQFTKTLGITWFTNSDKLVISGKKLEIDVPVVTKRVILSLIARLFDPLGLAGPVVLTAKTILQQLWDKKVDWDQPLDNADVANWTTFLHQLQRLNLEVPRCVMSCQTVSVINLHGFCDASIVAYGCCVYIQCEANGNRTSHLLCAKSRVAPLKVITIPRLELCSAVLLAELVQRVKSAMQIPVTKTVLWSDSTVALAWIRSQSNRLKTFVSHRVAEIQDLTDVSCWRHISTAENPADVISRGLMPEELPNSKMWWHGPSFLLENETKWPQDTATVNMNLPEMKSVVLVAQIPETWPVLTRFSCLSKLQRVLAYVLRFSSNCRQPTNCRRGPLTAEEIQTSLTRIVRAVQLESIPEYSLLCGGKPIPTKSSLTPLNIFVDDQKLLRVGGRIRNSSQGFDTKHQILLPKTHHVTKLLIRHLHEVNGHVGQQALLAIVRQRYWPLGARSITRDITRSCVRCFRYSPRTTEQFMGDLPSYRVNAVHPFTNTGVDYAGPLTLKLSRRVNTKAYVAVFVCLATKAVHLELVSDLTSNAFIAALTRFVSRRGLAANIYSDNGTNFVGARSELAALYKALVDPAFVADVTTECAKREIQFHTIPPRAPHFGGIWEAAVKSFKYHLRRIIGPAPLYFEEMATVLTRIEAILNSRPLTPLSADAEDIDPLTPGHFLIGRPLVAVVEPNLEDVSINRLNRWQLLQRLSQHFWRRWTDEYLVTLQHRVKHAMVTKIAPGMVVLVKEECQPSSNWLLGRITRVHPGRDGVVRVVSLKTKHGELDRPVTKICILPILSNELQNQKDAEGE